MPITKTQSGAIVCTGEGVTIFQLLAVKHAIKLESLGMKHSSGRSVRKHWAIKLGLKPNAKCGEVLSLIQSILDKVKE